MTQKCSGYGCLHRDRCEHYEVSKGKPTKGKWINADECINADTPYQKLKVKNEQQQSNLSS